jgi:hypothetical protein
VGSELSEVANYRGWLTRGGVDFVEFFLTRCARPASQRLPLFCGAYLIPSVRVPTGFHFYDFLLVQLKYAVRKQGRYDGRLKKMFAKELVLVNEYQ